MQSADCSEGLPYDCPRQREVLTISSAGKVFYLYWLGSAQVASSKNVTSILCAVLNSQGKELYTDSAEVSGRYKQPRWKALHCNRAYIKRVWREWRIKMRKSEKDLTEHRAAQTAVEEGDDRETSEGEEEEEEEEGGWEESNEEYCFDSDGSKAVPVANSGTIPLYDDASEGSALVYPVWGQASSDYETEEGSSPPRKRQKRESECGTCTSPETSQYCTTEASSDDMAESEKVMDCPQNAVVTLDDLQLGWLAVLKAADLPITENDAEKKAEGKFLEVLMERNQTRAVDIAGRAIEVLRCVAEGMTERKKKIWEKFRSKKKQQGLRIWKQSRSQPTLTAEWERSLKHAEKQLRNQLLEFVKTHCEGVPSTKEIIKGCLYALEGRLEDISRNRFRLDIANLEEPPEAPAAKPQQPRENGLYSGDYHRQSSGNLGCEALEASTTVVFDPEEVCIGDLLRIQQQSRCYTAESLFVHGIVVSIKGSQGGQEGPKDVDKVAIEVVVAGRQPSVLHLIASDFQKGLVHKIDKQKFGKTGLHVLQGQAAEYTSQRSELAAEKDVAQILAATEIAEEGKKELARLVVLRRWARQPFASFHGARGLAEMSVPHRTKLINICWDRNAFQKPVVLERSIVAESARKTEKALAKRRSKADKIARQTEALIRQKKPSELLEITPGPETCGVAVPRPLFDETDRQHEGVNPVVPGRFVSIMKPHQWEGVRFIWRNMVMTSNEEQSCILAHSMGLGKSLQVVVFLHLYHTVVAGERSLLVVPANVVYNWQAEFAKWLPRPRSDDAKDSELQLEKVFVFEHTDDVEAWSQDVGSVLIISYTQFANKVLVVSSKKSKTDKDCEQDAHLRKLLRSSASIVVADEAHELRNPAAKKCKALSLVSTTKRLALTGYPLQNRLGEYYSMICWVRPDYLGSRGEFQELFERPIESGLGSDASEDIIADAKRQLSVLVDLTKDFIQRRGAEILEKALPKKREHVILLKMPPTTEKLYIHVLEELKSDSRSGDRNGVFRDKVWCAECCNCPKKFLQRIEMDSKSDAREAEEQTKCLSANVLSSLAPEVQEHGDSRDAMDRPCPPDLAGRILSAVSGVCSTAEPTQLQNPKLLCLEHIIRYCDEHDEKLVVFSESLKILDEVQDMLYEKFGWSLHAEFLRLEGKTRMADRQEQIQRFNQANVDETEIQHAKVFLMSTKAGSLGINLTSARRMVVLDQPFNPVHNAQAIARIYRYGQEQNTYIYWMLFANTFEHKCYNRGLLKEGLSSVVVDEKPTERVVNSSAQDFYAYESPSGDAEALHGDLISRANGDLLLEHLLGEDDFLTAVVGIHDHKEMLQEDITQRLSDKEREEAAQGYVDIITQKHSKQGTGKSGKSQQIEKLIEVRNVNLNPPCQGQSIVVNAWNDAHLAHPPMTSVLAAVPGPADIRRHNCAAVQWHGYSNAIKAPSGPAVEPPVNSPQPEGYNAAAALAPEAPGEPTEHGPSPATIDLSTPAMDTDNGDGIVLDGTDPPDTQGQTDGSDHYAPQEQYDETESTKAHCNQGAHEGRGRSMPEVIDLLQEDD